MALASRDLLARIEALLVERRAPFWAALPLWLSMIACACRKSNPSVLVMPPAQDRTAKNVSGQLNGARHRRVLI